MQSKTLPVDGLPLGRTSCRVCVPHLYLTVRPMVQYTSRNKGEFH